MVIDWCGKTMQGAWCYCHERSFYVSSLFQCIKIGRSHFTVFCVEGVMDSTLVQASAFWDASVWACVEHQIEKLQNTELCWFNLEDWFVQGWLQGNVVLSTQPEWKFHYSLADCFLEQQAHISQLQDSVSWGKDLCICVLPVAGGSKCTPLPMETGASELDLYLCDQQVAIM